MFHRVQHQGGLLIFCKLIILLQLAQASLHDEQYKLTNHNNYKSGLNWRNLAVTIGGSRDTNNNQPNFLLHPSSGFVENGSLCGIIGPSGRCSQLHSPPG